MDDNFWWLGLYRNVKDKRCKRGRRLARTTFHITSKSKIKVELIENELKSKIVKYEKTT